jgi:protein TonB
MTRQRSNFASVLVLSALLHVIVLGASLVHWPWLRTVIPVQVTPVTLLTTAQIAKMAAAAQSDTPQSAQAKAPVPDAPPDAPTPEPDPAPPEPPPAPKPAPTPKVAPAPKEPTPKPEPKTAPTPKPTEKAPTPKPEPKTEPKAAPSRPAPGLDLDALAQSISRTPRAPSGPPQSSAPKGPTREELDLQQRAAEGAAKAAINDFRAGIADQLSRAWRPNCGVEGVSALRIRVRLTIARDGGLIEAKLVDYPDENAIGDPVVRAAATRAMTAARTSAPYRNLPPVTAYDQWKSFIVAFDGKNVC